ncbi:hypothetical protein [Clostridium sp. L74]|uniref:hypothetical protein n=1 Tax=Clostridium sp. L74 TaxID=1560217 RepID=UPI0006C356C4|nr:hypothetical protein [Clostridium sp. L74]KOR25090.1 CAAX amino terminal protease [Clostridium sp. L74]
MYKSGFNFLYINSNIRNFFIGAVIFIISGILLEKYIRELKYDGTNISSAG